MRRYDLTILAENDLIEISDYTARTWGEEQAERYLQLLDGCFVKIAEGKVLVKQPLAGNPKLKSMHCEQHYIFSSRAKSR